MTELASGSVRTLLGVISNEAQLLGGVEGDVQFIKEEMESIHSFLSHLARTVPPSGEHDEQVRTWTSQVRLLAQDCNNCIQVYLYRGDPDIHLPKHRLWRYLMWAPWFLRKTMALHHAAIRLRELKERARDVSQRRKRYGVEVPAKVAAASGQPPASGAVVTSEGAEEDEEQDSGDQLAVVDTVMGHFGRWPFEPCSWEDSCERRLHAWMEDIAHWKLNKFIKGLPSIAIVASDEHQQDEACALAHEALDARQVHHVLVDIPKLHPKFQPLKPKDILYYILRELKLEHARTQSQAKQQEATSSGHQDDARTQSQAKQQEVTSSGHQDGARTQSKAKQQKSTSSDHQDGARIQSQVKHQKATSSGPQDDAKTQSQAKQQEAAPSGHRHYGRTRNRVSKRVWMLLVGLSKSNEQKEFFNKINDNIQQMAVYEKLENVKREILQVKGDQLQCYLESEIGISSKPLGLLLLLMLVAVEHDQVWKKKAKRIVAAFYKDFIKEIGLMLKDLMEDGEKQPPPIRLSTEQYEQILREVFPETSYNNTKGQEENIITTADKVEREALMTGKRKALQDQDQEQYSSADNYAIRTTLGEDPAEEISHVDEQEVKEDKQHRKQAIPKQDGHGEIIPASMVHETMENIKKRIKAQMKIKGIVDEIKKYLKDNTMIILKVNEKMDGSLWEKLRLLDYMFSALIMTTTRSTDRAKEYCYPSWMSIDPIDCSPIGLYHTTVLKLANQKMQQDNRIPQLFRNILENCEPHEFCMKIFAHALYSKPMRSYEELNNLCSSLQAVSPKSLSTIARKMIMFSYNDLTKEDRSCLLYLAIFPQGHIIRRSDLIGRWVVEGLITEDWSWPSSVDKAERCFETLINRWFVCPVDIGLTGDVKSCMVDDLVYEFITRIAKKQRTLQLSMPHHLARYFSTSIDLRLRASDKIDSFFEKLPKTPQFSLLTVLDVENCRFGGKNKRYIKDICDKIILLKYLSLRGTDVTHLPKNINKLHHLEVLDIRCTKVPMNATRNVRLLKLKRFLAGQDDPSNTCTGTAFRAEECPCSVQIPDKIDKMLDMEVLSNVTVLSNHALEEIGALSKLRKLAVVIEEKDSLLESLLVAISNMYQCLFSLSITILPITKREGTLCQSLRMGRTPSSANNDYRLRYPLQILESLSINGTTQNVKLLQRLLDLDKDHSQLSNVSLCSTCLEQVDLNVLAVLPNLVSMKFGDKAYTESKFTLKSNGFKNLRFFHVEGTNMTGISFEDGAASELEKIVLYFTNSLEYISGVENLLKLKELELNNNKLLPLFDKANQIAKVTLVGTSFEKSDLQMLARKPNMHCLALLDTSYIEGHLIFNKDEFSKLKFLTIDCSNIINISFNRGSTPNLKKIIWSFNKDTSVTLSGINNLPRLKELELKGGIVTTEVKEYIERQKNKLTLKLNKPKKQEQAK